VDEKGVHVDPNSTQVIHDCLTLKTITNQFLLGFSYISWSPSQVSKGGVKAKFVWATSQQKTLEDLKFFLFLALILSLLDLQQPFDIEIDALDYYIGAFLTQHGNLIAYHNETIYDVFCRYPTYDKEMYCIV
jgi:hypothetical protein